MKRGLVDRSHIQLLLEQLEPRLLLSSVEWLPGLVGPQDLVEHTRGQVIYLDFDGADNVTYDGPVTVEGIHVPAFSAAGPGLAGHEGQLIERITQRTAELLASLRVHVTSDQPVDGEFSTIYVGGSNDAFAVYGNFWGLAEAVDVGNANRQDEAFVFSGETWASAQSAGDYVRAVSNVAAHEVGHLLGLIHDDGLGAPSVFNRGDCSPEEFALGRLAHDMSPGREVHQWITIESTGFYSNQFSGAEIPDYLGTIPGSHVIPGPNSTLLEGAADEDVDLLTYGTWENPFDQWEPFYRHFCEGGDGTELTIGWFDYDSAYTQADRYWDDYVLSNYPSNKGSAYYYLGHVAHLLQDVTVPAHVHNDPHPPWNVDAYEVVVATDGYYQNFGMGTPNQPYGIIALPGSLLALFELTADYTDDYDSSDYEGDTPAEYPLGYREAGRHRPDAVDRSDGIDNIEVGVIANDLMPWAMEQMAALFRLFYSQVDGTAPIVALYNLSADESNPTHKPGTFTVSGWSLDGESGVNTHLTTWRKSGGSWVDETDWGHCGGGGSVAQQISLTTDGVYRIQLTADNGAGLVSSTSHYYFDVSDAPEPIMGDINWDGAVDGADYTIWADHYKQAGGWTEGDLTGDGFVDGADYNIWADNLTPPPIPGDTNRDGAVDGADYTVWADNYLLQSVPAWMEGGWMFGNFNADDVVDDADYTIWADNFTGGGGGSAAALPVAGSADVQEARGHATRRKLPTLQLPTLDDGIDLLAGPDLSVVGLSV